MIAAAEVRARPPGRGEPAEAEPPALPLREGAVMALNNPLRNQQDAGDAG